MLIKVVLDSTYYYFIYLVVVAPQHIIVLFELHIGDGS